MTIRSLLMAMAILVAWAALAPAQAQYQLQPGDTLQISVWQEPRLDRQITVAPDGSIALPLAGRIQAAQRTAAQVEQALKASLGRDSSGRRSRGPRAGGKVGYDR